MKARHVLRRVIVPHGLLDTSALHGSRVSDVCDHHHGTQTSSPQPATRQMMPDQESTRAMIGDGKRGRMHPRSTPDHPGLAVPSVLSSDSCTSTAGADRPLASPPDAKADPEGFARRLSRAHRSMSIWLGPFSRKLARSGQSGAGLIRFGRQALGGWSDREPIARCAKFRSKPNSRATSTDLGRSPAIPKH